MSQFISLNTIIGNGKSYKVPVYQRDYSWRKNEEVEDLWNDLLDLSNGDTHYMGHLVLLPENEQNKSYWIMDGQQRLITVSLLALAVIKLLKEWADAGVDRSLNEERKNEEIRRYIGNVDTGAKESHSFLPILPKLSLNRNNDDYYKSYLMQLRPVNVLSKQKPSVRLLQQAFDFFYDKLKEKFDAEKSGSNLTQFLEKTVGNGLVFTVIEVQSDLDAFKIFETLNARGVELSPADLLKNYLFSQAALRGTIELDEAERRWLNISNTLGKKDLTIFIKHFWNSQHKLTRDPALFKAIKTEVTGANKAFDLLNNLEWQAEYYVGFDNPANEELWSKDERRHLQTIALLEISTCYPLMMAWLAKLDRNSFHILLREISVIALRYIMADQNPNEAERLYSETANQIYAGKLTTVKEITLALKNIYATDNQFEAAFASAEINTRRKKGFVKYLLVNLENQMANTEYAYEDASATIEHILPENPDSIWEQAFSPQIQEDSQRPKTLSTQKIMPAQQMNRVHLRISPAISKSWLKPRFADTEPPTINSGVNPPVIQTIFTFHYSFLIFHFIERWDGLKGKENSERHPTNHSLALISLLTVQIFSAKQRATNQSSRKIPKIHKF